MPPHHIQCATRRRFGTQATRKGRCRFTRGHIAGLLQVTVLPAANHAQFDLVPVTLNPRAIHMPIARAHHHAIGLNHQPARRRSMLLGWWFMELIDVRHAATLLTLQFGADPFGLAT